MALITRRTAAAAFATVTVAGFGRKLSAASSLRSLSNLTATTAPLPVPPLKLVAADGGVHALGDFVGQGVVLNCWATWCIPCVAEMPALAQLAGLVKDDKIAVIPLSSDRGGRDVVQAFYHSHEISGLPIWLDPDGDAVHTLSLRGIPTTLVIDREGRERARVEGAADWSSPESVAKIKALVAQ
jgi:thiol-disulfide isomerase/thioredoxin